MRRGDELMIYEMILRFQMELRISQMLRKGSELITSQMMLRRGSKLMTGSDELRYDSSTFSCDYGESRYDQSHNFQLRD